MRTRILLLVWPPLGLARRSQYLPPQQPGKQPWSSQFFRLPAYPHSTSLAVAFEPTSECTQTNPWVKYGQCQSAGQLDRVMSQPLYEDDTLAFGSGTGRSEMNCDRVVGALLYRWVGAQQVPLLSRAQELIGRLRPPPHSYPRSP